MAHRFHLRIAAALAAMMVFSLTQATAGSWSDRRPMDDGRSHLGAAAIGEYVYVAGGSGRLGPSRAFEAYDTFADHWRPLPVMPKGIEQFGMAALGKHIYVSGGYSEASGSRPIADVSVFDTDTARWDSLPPMPQGRAGHALVAFGGALYVFGGAGSERDHIYRYNPSRKQWETLGSRMPEARAQISAVAGDNAIYIIGGRAQDGTLSRRVDIFDPASGNWRRGADLPMALSSATAGFHRGRVHVAGGLARGGDQTSSAHLVYNAAANSWSREVDLPTPRHSLASAMVENRWYVFGGGLGVGIFAVFTVSDAVEVYGFDG
jgi:N-acetylneuraminic acid mutarotase